MRSSVRLKSLTRHAVQAHQNSSNGNSSAQPGPSATATLRLPQLHSEWSMWRTNPRSSILADALGRLSGMGSAMPICQGPSKAVTLTSCRGGQYQQCRSLHSFDVRQFNSISLLEVKKFLRQKGIKFEESDVCLKITIGKHYLVESASWIDRCQWGNVDSSVTPLFINKTTETFVCPELALFGDWSRLQPFLVNYSRVRNSPLGQAEVVELPSIDLVRLQSLIKDLWESASPVESLSGQDFKELLKQFSLCRELRPEDFAFHQVRFTYDEETGRYDLLFPVRYPFYDKIIGLKRVTYDPELKQTCEENIPSQKELQSVFQSPPTTPSTPHGSEMSVGKLMPFMYGTEKCQKSDSVVVVSSVLDALTLTSRNISVIALAEGPVLLPPDHLPFLENYSEITFWFPNDAASADTVSVFGRKLGEKRCRYVSRDIDQPSVYLRRKPKASARDVIRSHTKPCAHEHITTFDSLREDVFLEFAQFEETEGVKFKRFDALNETLRGFRRGELTVFTGRTGAGKTTFISEYSLDLCAQNVNTLWGSFEVKNVRLAKTQLRQFSGVNLEDNLESFDYWADKFSKLPMYYLTFHGAQEVDKVLDAMGYAVYVFDIAHVIIDNLQFMMGSDGAGTDRWQAQDQIISKFRKFATLHNVHMTLVIHPRKEDGSLLTANSIFGGAKATQEADNVMLLQEEEVSAKVKRKFIQIVKNRFSGDLGIVPLFFNKGTATFSKKIYSKDRAQAKQQRALKQAQDLGSSGNPSNQNFRDATPS